MNHKEALTAYSAGIVHQLIESGVDKVVVSPGSRSTPLALMLAEHPNMELYINIDERSAGFFALGLAKASHTPVAILCTSGTAAANYFPAIIEARYSRVPLIVLTADRPHELREVGAPQAIDQVDLYGKHVKWFVDLPIPEENPAVLSFVQSAIKRSVLTAIEAPSGPVHLNIPFREPLLPDLALAKNYFISTDQGFYIGKKRISSEIAENLAKELNEKQKGLIICGPMENSRHVKSIIQLAKKLQFPLLADPLSYLRGSYEDEIIGCYDSFLRVEELGRQLEPDLVIRFGAMPVSKALSTFLQKQKTIPHWIIDPGSDWRDPNSSGRQTIYADESLFCEDILSYLAEGNTSEWLEGWKVANHITMKEITSLKTLDSIDEVTLFSTLGKNLPPSSTLFVGNSMPIRDMDTFFQATDQDITVLANRGANGIDGIVSAALGVGAVKPNTYLIIGDLSFFHDLNGLLAAKMNKINITIILINNDGGGIFSYLPQAKDPTHYELLFGTPTNIDFKKSVEQFGGQFVSVQTRDEWEKSMELTRFQEGISVIEVCRSRSESVDSHRSFWRSVSQEIRNWLEVEEL
ncbi:2-succinyl-5-enolpyruvyl-6-hydroxy-3-cyclohexene-1-carboxylic-acid synthase [Bacillus sp. 2205SS5-2]|uniref:2-succinyl-5-enolpyruvyl-6-hydroxy-3- cyclohexene-1-carboxylic-acid synthase n=1 Tax=Bacillus sp. 2205SS5-2 TaxID=3109031 RepID=UPI00300766BC